MPEGAPQVVDVAIIGGGMAGLALALMLAARAPSLRVTILERVTIEPSSEPLAPSFDARSTALAAGSQQLLQELGLWEALEPQVAPIHQVHVSEKGRPLGVLMQSQLIERQALGYVAENRQLGRALLAAVQQQPNLHLVGGVHVEHLQFTTGQVHVTQANGETLVAKLAVVADGADSPLRGQLMIATRQRDYDQVAIVANVEPELPPRGIAYERFTDSGPMALLPLSEVDGRPRQALIWTLPERQAETVLALDDLAFAEAVYRQFGRRVGRFVKVSPRASYPLQLMFADEQVRSRLVIAGSAAHHLHPVAGQGFNLILRDCDALTSVLAHAAAQGRDIGALDVLQHYQHAQHWDQLKTVSASDLLPRLFSNRDSAALALRQLALLGLDFAPHALGQFTRQAAGLGGRR